MKFLLFLLSFFLMTSCDKHASDIECPKRDKQHSINVIRAKVANELKNTTGLVPCGFGAQAMNEIVMLALSFNYYKHTTVDEGRKLLIRAVDEFVSSVNADEPIRLYLSNYPFKPKNIEITIFLQNPNGSKPPLGELCVISAIEDIFSYEIRSPETNRLETLYEETYEKLYYELLEISRVSQNFSVYLQVNHETRTKSSA